MYNHIIGPTDTDSISFCKADMTKFTKEEIDSQIKELNSISPEFMVWDNDGVYEKVLILKAKNYILQKDRDYCKPKDLDQNGNVKLIFKGSSIKDQRKEPALLEFLKKCINLILDEEPIEKMIKIYQDYCKEAMNPADINRWLVKKTITEKVLDPKRSNEEKVLDACNNAIKAGAIQGIQAGDKVYVYQAIDGLTQAKAKGELVFNKKGEPKMIENCILKFGELYNNDHDKIHYVQRVYDTLQILENVIDITKFQKYHLKSNQKLLEKLK